MTIIASDHHNEKPEFKIENNMIIGQELNPPNEPLNSGEIIYNVFKNNPDVVGQIEALTGRKSTFREMLDRSVRCAIWLKKQGVKPGDIVGLCADNQLDAYVPLLGCLYIGAICATWDHVLAISSARHYLRLTSPSIIFLHANSVDVLHDAAQQENVRIKTVVFENVPGVHESLDDILFKQTPTEVDDFRCQELTDPSAVAAIVSSSGTTGLPKGTELTHLTIRMGAHPVKLHEYKGVSMWSPTLRWQYGIVITMKALRACGTRVLVPDYDDALAYCEFIEKYNVEHFSTDPCILTQLLKYGTLKSRKLPSLKMVDSSGSPLKREIQEEISRLLPHAFVGQFYGLTDAGMGIAGQAKGCQPGSCGYVVPGITLKFVDTNTGVALGPKEIGEICVRSQTLMKGYYKNPEATRKAIDAEGWLHTGDMGHYTETGEIYVIGRISDFIDYRTINVSPAEIESVLSSHPAVHEVTVIGIPHEIDSQHPLAVVSKLRGKEVTEEELIALVDTELPDYCKLRGGVRFVDKLPHTTTGKIAKKQVKEMIINH